MSSLFRVNFDYNHPRTKKARLGRAFLRPRTQALIKLAIAVLSASAGLMAVFSLELGAITLAIALVFINLQLWLHGEMVRLPAKMPIGSEELNLHEALDRRVLGRLQPDIASPKLIWRSVRGMWRQQFFSVRYGMGMEIFDTALSDKPEDGPAVWQKAVELAHKENQGSITGAALTVALLMSIEGYDEWIAQLHLEPNDLIVGIDWQRHIELVAERIAHRSHMGGLARDWTAGYTPTLNRLGHNVSLDIQYGGFLHRDLKVHRDTVDQVLYQLSSGGRPNVALVGNVGVGKTTTVHSFAQRILFDKSVPENIRYHQVYTLNAPSLLAQVTDRASLEFVMLSILAEARAAQNIILFLDEAQLFFNQGTGAVDLSNILLPVLENGAIRIIMAMSPNQWQTLSAHNQALAGLINYLAIREPDEQDTKRIMEDQVLLIEQKHGVVFMYQALNEAYRVADRYMHDIAFPGKAIRVMEAAVNKAAGGKLVTEESVQKAIETTLGVKVQGASREEKQQLLNLEDQIHERMVNQKRAVKVVSDALRRARSGVGNPRKPIGTFLFLGPTGVGKTELAKAIADVYFGGESEVVRVDMNEFVQSNSIDRLLEVATEAGTSLLAKIRKQPFSVVLFDEIEKAHPDVVNVFLQLLDEGIMRDNANREISFRDAIVIATSNAGADHIRANIEAGKQLEDFEQQFVDGLIDAGDFRPEFLNRFDEIVVFRPLNKEELLQVVDLLIASVNRVLARQKVQVSLQLDAKQWLVEHGYDARLGARPLRRMVQRSVENIVAKKILSEDFRPGSTLTLTAHDLESTIED